MDLMSLIDTVAPTMLIALILLKQQEKKDAQMLKTNEELLDTNKSLANTVKEISVDMSKDVKETKHIVLDIKEQLKGV